MTATRRSCSPPDVRDWLPADHLAWFVLDVVDQLDLTGFYASYRADGTAGPLTSLGCCWGCCWTPTPSGCALPARSSGAAAKTLPSVWLTGNQTPDHVIVARFRVRHEHALAGFLVQSLRLCAAAGMVRVGTVALDGTKVAGNAAEKANRTRARGKQPKARIKPRARDEASNPKRVANVTDPDSRLVHTRKGSIQGYNARAATTCEQVIVAAELTQDANDLQQLQPMLEATAATLAAAIPSGLGRCWPTPATGRSPISPRSKARRSC